MKSGAETCNVPGPLFDMYFIHKNPMKMSMEIYIKNQLNNITQNSRSYALLPEINHALKIIDAYNPLLLLAKTFSGKEHNK